jgi:primosomal protein N' (replication factor Y)
MRDALPAESPVAARPLYAEIVVPRHIRGSFTYLVPTSLQPILRVGQCVYVPFGRSQLQGAVISLTDTLPAGVNRERVKEISSVAEADGHTEIPPELLELARQVADYYVAPLGQCLRLVLPPSGGGSRRTSRLTLTALGREALATASLMDGARSLLERLRKRPAGISTTTLLKHDPPTQRRVVRDLLRKAWIAEVHAQSDFADFVGSLLSRTALSVSSPDEELHSFADESTLSALESRLCATLEGGQPDTVVLQASLANRIEFLRRAIHRTVTSGRSVLVLAGETDRARWLAGRLAQRGIAVAACLHSALPDEVRAEVWRRVREAEPQVVVGTRSAVFLPFRSLGMIWVEQAGDPSFKEPQEPRYHARDVARMRMQSGQGLLVLGCAQIPLDVAGSLDNAGLVVRDASSEESKPIIEVVDLRSFEKGTVFSRPLLDAMREAIDRRSGALLFLNRKGYANALVCRDCGQVPRCDSCLIALAYSRRMGKLLCSYCGTTVMTPSTCPACSGHRLRPVGDGTERIEEEVSRLFPGVRIVRADKDTMRKPSQVTAGWKAIQDRQWDVLIGTQLVLRDYAVPLVGLVGVIHGDASLNLPDFRAAERSYHMLCGAVALALPAKDGGRVVIQSLLPSHHAIQAVVHQDESIFSTEELRHRTALGYPPAVQLIGLYVSGRDQVLVEKAASELADRIRASLAVSGQVLPTGLGENAVLGPVPPPGPNVRGRHRRRILVKTLCREPDLRSVRQNLEVVEDAYPRHAIKFDVDVDPVEMW